MRNSKKRAISLALVLVLCLGLSVPAWAAGFVDVKPGDYYAEAVNWAVERGITTGTSAATFSPDDTCTRGQILTFLWRAVGSPEYHSWPRQVTDVSPGAYYYKAVLWAVQWNLFDGNTFRPNDPCTRLETMELLWRHSNWRQEHWQKTSDSGFADTDSLAVKWAVDRGITTGTSATTFSPDQICTRGQIVSFLYRHYSVNPFDTFTNADSHYGVRITQNEGRKTVKVEFLYEGETAYIFPHLDLSPMRDQVNLNAVLLNAPGTTLKIELYLNYADVSIDSSLKTLMRFNGRYLRGTGGFAADQMTWPE